MVFVLDALLRWLRAQPDEPKAEGLQRFRLVLVIDEAKRIMEAAPKEMMEALILECRSKGLGTLLISQSPDHLDGLSDDLVRSLEVAVCFEADVEARSLQRMFNRARPETVRQLQKGQCLARTPNSKTPKVIQAWVPDK
jgi:ABC-type sugar transport system ATPase subunit